ncbi:pyrroloquinoline quinone biosynthesis peptide chaperone PqqD [Amaricoccus solimangrovi]|uniref:Pyrroloquinoline quinone biosynthesis peptide chaperone PqqD n=1 Tax=Amaricoccus solimangrovi TaxID=2589815 RepID=A0A501WW92_9RHOB|nr:pyrroloquinoline quinone biosynthesis peptide chaperone PqqD [Amaricoccus solimangrovi]TPE52515.1 pyrroloquinoline quinone biosynthesis peptide chaperone PqqD [Amaricoccus solimangrovi]
MTAAPAPAAEGAAPTLAPEAVPFLPRGVRLHFDTVRGAWVLLAPERALRLDTVGHAILSRIDGERSLGAIARDLAATFNAPFDQILADSAGYLSALLDRRVLELRP